MTSIVISEKQAQMLQQGLDRTAYAFGETELDRLRRLSYRGLVHILASGKATASYDTTEKGRTFLQINSGSV